MKLGCGHCRLPSDECDCPKSVQDSTPIVPLRDPETTIRRHANAVRMEIIRDVLNSETWEMLLELAVERATGIGAEQYGTTTWDKLLPDVRQEGNCEIADLIFYRGVERDIA